MVQGCVRVEGEGVCVRVEKRGEMCEGGGREKRKEVGKEDMCERREVCNVLCMCFVWGAICKKYSIGIHSTRNYGLGLHWQVNRISGAVCSNRSQDT